GARRPRSRASQPGAGCRQPQPDHLLSTRRWRPIARQGAAAMKASLHAETHEVFNQVPPLDGANLYRLDLPLQEWTRRFGGGWAEQKLLSYGALAGGELMVAGFLANENK